MISKLFGFVWLGATVSVFCGIYAAMVDMAARVTWLTGEAKESWTPIHTYALARAAAIGAVTKNKILYELVEVFSAFFCETSVSPLVMRAPGKDGRYVGQ